MLATKYCSWYWVWAACINPKSHETYYMSIRKYVVSVSPWNIERGMFFISILTFISNFNLFYVDHKDYSGPFQSEKVRNDSEDFVLISTIERCSQGIGLDTKIFIGTKAVKLSKTERLFVNVMLILGFWCRLTFLNSSGRICSLFLQQLLSMIWIQNKFYKNSPTHSFIETVFSFVIFKIVLFSISQCSRDIFSEE